MKTYFDTETRKDLIGRIQRLNDSSKPSWGKMNVIQAVKHCIMVEEMFLGKKTYKRVFLGRILGKMVLNKMLKDETPIEKNARTSPLFQISEQTGDLEVEKKRWIELIEEYDHFANDNYAHWFFGKMNKEQIGQFAYKHTDHHLRQFNA